MEKLTALDRVSVENFFKHSFTPSGCIRFPLLETIRDFRSGKGKGDRRQCFFLRNLSLAIVSRISCAFNNNGSKGSEGGEPHGCP